MGFFQRLKQRSELRRVRRDAKEFPTPLIFVNLIDKLVECEQVEEAETVAKDALTRFPDSELIRTAYRRLMRLRNKEELKALRGELRRSADPLLYARLADLYLELGEEELAQDLALSAVEKFPQSDGNYIVLGKIRARRFAVSHQAKDGFLSIQYFERAVELNRDNYRSLLTMAEILVEVGQRTRALQVLEQILRFAPNDPRARRLRERALRLPNADERFLEDAFRKYEDLYRRGEGHRYNGYSPAERFLKEPTLLKKKLAQFSGLEGLKFVVALAPGGKILASFTAPGERVDRLFLAQKAERLFNATEDCSVRMDLGALKHGLFDGGDTKIMIMRFDIVRFALFMTRAVKVNLLDRAVRNFLEHELFVN